MHNRQRQFKQPRGASRHDDPLDFVARVLFKLVNTPGFARCFTEGPDKFQRAESSDCLNLE